MKAEQQLCFAALHQNTAGIFPHHFSSKERKKNTDKAEKMDNKLHAGIQFEKAQFLKNQRNVDEGLAVSFYSHCS